MGELLAGGLPAITAQAPAVMDETAKQAKKQGVASMLSGIGKGAEEGIPEIPHAPQGNFDVSGFLASLFGG